MALSYDFERFFPFQKIRNEQRIAIEFALNAFLNENKRFVILDLGVGVGKSAIGVTIARYLASTQLSLENSFASNGAYILTPQKILQEQYIKDFGQAPGKKGLLHSLKSSNNFECTHCHGQSCAESRRVLSKLKKQLIGTQFHENCTKHCPYVKAKDAFLKSQIGITNFSFFLAATTYSEQISPRQLLICDEAHKLESELGKFIEITFSEKFATEILECELPKLVDDEDKNFKIVFTWLKRKYKPALAEHIQSIESLIESQVSNNPDQIQLGNLSKQYELLDKHICKLNRFLDECVESNWVLNVVLPDNSNTKKKISSYKKYEFKPIDVALNAEQLLYRFGEKVLLMSATILDKEIFCKTVGINTDDVAYLTIPSPFPIENRQINILNVGKMSKDCIDATLPKMAEVVNLLLEKHDNVKGIIHTTNFKISQFLLENIKSDRLLTHDSNNRDIVLRQHLYGKEPTVLVSPSMMEGVDLVDDASRFQILCKLPFPYLGDKVVKKRKERDNQWYAFQTIMSIVQAFGRSIRNENDYASSYILDSGWWWFYKQNEKIFPKDFSKLLIK